MLRKYVVTLQPLWWRKYFWKARFLRKVFRKNLSKRFGSCRKTPYLCTRFDEDNTSRMRKFLRRFRWWKKSSKRFGSYQKTSYLCTRFDEDNTSRVRKFLGRFDDEKNLSKRFGDLKNLPYLCTTFPLFGAGLWQRWNSEQNWNKVLWRFWAAKKVLSTLAREWFQTIPLRLELKI